MRIAAVALCVACSQCTGGSPSSPTPNHPANPGLPSSPTPSPPLVYPPQTFAGAGDIASCVNGNQDATARILDTIDGMLFTLGDNAYMDGSARQYRECYDPSWGRFKNRTRPTPGNHEYETLAAAPYFDYFGANAGPRGLGYYSFELGAWHIIALNSEIGTGINTLQGQWLLEDLEANTTPCTLAYWHKPLFSSGPNGDNLHMRPFWRILYEFGADVVLNGHDHIYERFLPQDPDGRYDPARGMTEFIVGTGGVPLYPILSARPNSDQRITDTHGILKLTLMTDSYDWEFISVARGRRDSGTGTCH